MMVVKVNKLMVLIISALIFLTYLVFYRSDEMFSTTFMKARPIQDVVKIDPPILPSAKEIPSKINMMKFPVHFKISRDYEQSLLHYESYMMQQLHKNHIAVINNSFKVINKTSTYSTCQCGRVSDPCLCCTKLLPFVYPGTTLQKKMYRPIIVSSNDSNIPVYCFKLTYKAFKDVVLVSAFIIDAKKDTSTEQLISAAENFPESEKRTIFTDTTVATHAESQLCGVQGPYSLCLRLHDLDYKVSHDNSVKTYFIGCATLLINRDDYIISLYNIGCFKAHKGATADVEMKSDVKKAQVALKQLNATVIVNDTSKSKSLINKVNKEVEKHNLVPPVAEQDVHRGGI